jgi:hypothetical protein
VAINAEKLESVATIREKSVSPTNDRSVPLVSTCSNTPGYNTAFSFTILELLLMPSMTKQRLG